MKKRIIRLGAVLLLVAAQLGGILVPVQQASAAGMTCTWTGAVSASWNDSGNWSGCSGTVPVNDDTILLPASGSNKAIVNDASSVNVRQIVVDPGATGYSIGTNALTINQTVTAAESIAFSNAVTIGAVGFTDANLRAKAGATISFTGNVTLNNTSTSVGDTSYTGTVDFVGTVGGSGSLYADNGSKVIVRGTSNVFAGSIVGASRAATFECRSLTCFGNSANTIFVNGGNVDIYANNTYGNPISVPSEPDNLSQIRAHDSVSLTGDMAVNDPLNISQGAAGKNLQFNGTLTFNQNVATSGADATSNIRFDSRITGTGTLTANGGTTQLNSNANDYTGTTTVNSGAILQISQPNSLGGVGAGTTVLSGGSLVAKQTSTTNFAEPLTIEGAGTATTPGAIYGDGSSLTDAIFDGAITLGADATIANSGVTYLRINSAISGSHNVTVYGGDDGANDPGISFADGGFGANTYTGKTIITGGAFYPNKTGAVPGDLDIDVVSPAIRTNVYVLGNNSIADTSKVTLKHADATFSLSNTMHDEVIGGLAGTAGEVSFNNTNLIVDQAVDSVYAGNFYADGDAGTLTKRGAGKLVLTGDDTFGPDQINYVVEGGVLSVNGNLRTTSDGGVTVKSGATLKGTGTVGAVDIEAGGTLAPGNSPGTLNVTDLTLSSGGTHQVEIVGDSNYDRIIATGTVNLSGALDLNPTYTPAVGTQFVIVQAGIVSGTFDGLPDGATVSANGLNFRIDYVGNGVTLTYLGGTLVVPSSSNTPILGAPNTGVGSSTNMMVALLGTGLTGLVILTGYLARRKLLHTR